ncbi:MAG: DUF2304 domain-containing protein [Gemmatimonadota bacterium]
MIRTIFLLVYGLLLVGLALRRLRQRRLKERYFLLFVAVGLPFLLLAIWPDRVVYFSNLLEIEKPTLLVLTLAAFVILMLFELLTIVSVQDRKLTTLAQEVAMLSERLRQAEDEAGVDDE